MINLEMLNKTYNSEEDLVKKHPSCEYCPFEEILKPEQRKVGLLYKDIPKGNHPHREMIEQICGQNNDDICDMKYVAMRAPVDDFMMAQMGAVRIYKYDLGKAYQRPVKFQEAFMEWIMERSNISDDNGNPTSYAARWREVWDKSIDISGKQTLTEEGAYRIVMARKETYNAWKIMASTLSKEEAERDEIGANYLEKKIENENQ